MTAVITTPTELPEPLLPVAPVATTTTPAEDFDLLVALVGATLPVATKSAGTPVLPAPVAHDAPVTSDPVVPLVVAPAPRPAPLPLVTELAAAGVVAGESAPDEPTVDLEDRSVAVDATALMGALSLPAPPLAPAPAPEIARGLAAAPPPPADTVTVARTSSLRPGVVDQAPSPDVASGAPSGEGVRATLDPTPMLAPALAPEVAKATTRVPVPAAATAPLPAPPTTDLDGGVPRPVVADAPPAPAPITPSATPVDVLTPAAAPVIDEPRPPIAARGRAVTVAQGRDAIRAEVAAIDTTPSSEVASLRRVATAGAAREETGEFLARASRDRDGGPEASPADATATTGAAGAASPRHADAVSLESRDGGRAEAPREVVEQITTRLRDVKGPGRHELSMRLDPPELGAVQIDARLDGARLHLVIRAEHANTSDLLADALPRLRDALTQQGFTPGTVSVHLGFDASGGQFARDGAPAFRPSQDPELPRPTQGLVPATARLAAVSDGLDVWA